MSNSYDDLAEVVLIVKSDESLKKCFNRLLQVGSSTQQVRVSALQSELTKMGAPEVVTRFVALLGNSQIAEQVLRQIND